jgi:hypothetical protein
MPYERPGQGFYATATKLTRHNDPCTENGVVGAAVKQRPTRDPNWGMAGAQDIAIGEPFHIRTKGIKQFPVTAGTKGVAVAAGARGQGVYIRPADNTLRLEGATAAGDLPFGRVVEVYGDGRGVPQGFIRIDLDLKETLAAAA